MKHLLPLLFGIIALSFHARAQESPGGDSAPVKLQLVGGDTVTGKVSGVKDDQVSVVTEYGAIRIPVAKLSDSSRKALGVLGDTGSTQMQTKIAELEALVEKLRTENAQLRRQRAMVPKNATTGIQPLSGGTAVKPSTGDTTAKPGGYRISSTGKRHNSRCRHYANSKGRNGSATEGVACKICGG